MKEKLILVVALSLSVAALTSFAQHAPSDSTARGPAPIPPTNPSNPYPTNPTPPLDQPGGMQSESFDSFRNLQDGDVLGVIAAIDSMEIRAARVVQGITQGKTGGDVAAFASMLRRDHEKNLKDAGALAKRINVKVANTGEPILMLRREGKTALAQLKTKNGIELEREYVKAMVQGHQKALQIIDTMMPPVSLQSSTPGTTLPGMGINSAEVRGFLTQTRVAVAEHLLKAQELQSQISVGQR